MGAKRKLSPCQVRGIQREFDGLTAGGVFRPATYYNVKARELDVSPHLISNIANRRPPYDVEMECSHELQREVVKRTDEKQP